MIAPYYIALGFLPLYFCEMSLFYQSDWSFSSYFVSLTLSLVSCSHILNIVVYSVTFQCPLSMVVRERERKMICVFQGFVALAINFLEATSTATEGVILLPFQEDFILLWP